MSFLLLNGGGGTDHLELNTGTGDLLMAIVDPVPDLTWYPCLPAPLPVRSFLRKGLQPAWAYGTLSPIPRPAPPTELTWHPTYSDGQRRRRDPRWLRAGAVSPVLHTLFFAAEAWKPVYPDRILRSRRPIPPPPFQIGAIAAIPTTGGWRPTFPDRIVRRPPTRTGLMAWVVDPTTLINAAPCVEWTDERLTAPQLTLETLTAPQLVPEALTNPGFAEEDLC